MQFWERQVNYRLPLTSHVNDIVWGQSAANDISNESHLLKMISGGFVISLDTMGLWYPASCTKCSPTQGTSTLLTCLPIWPCPKCKSLPRREFIRVCTWNGCALSATLRRNCCRVHQWPSASYLLADNGLARDPMPQVVPHTEVPGGYVHQRDNRSNRRAIQWKATWWKIICDNCLP